jgi:hypothetical protein
VSAETDWATWEAEQASVPFDTLPAFTGSEAKINSDVFTWWLSHRD